MFLGLMDYSDDDDDDDYGDGDDDDGTVIREAMS